MTLSGSTSMFLCDLLAGITHGTPTIKSINKSAAVIIRPNHATFAPKGMVRIGVTETVRGVDLPSNVFLPTSGRNYVR